MVKLTKANRIFSEIKGKNVLSITHNGINQEIIMALLGKEWVYIKDIGKLENTPITIFEFDEEGNSIQKLINCAKHFED